MKDPAKALVSLEEAVSWRESLRKSGRTLAVTNGCFDLLHRGHAGYLFDASQYADELLVLLNSDASVSALKGDTRPLTGELDRAYLLGALGFVSKVVIFDSSRCDKELAALKPDVYTKAGDYTLEKLDKSERAALENSGTKIVFMPFVPGYSTTGTIEKIQNALLKEMQTQP